MTTGAREWGTTLLRLWFGLAIAQQGLVRAKGQLSLLSLAGGGLFEAWGAFWTSPAAHAVSLGQLIAGAAIFAGVAVRPAALLSAAVAAWRLWEKGTGLAPLGADWPVASLLIVSVSLLLLGPGRMNLGALFRGR